MNAKQLIHIWSQQTKQTKRAGNVYFNGVSLHFYAAEIGKFYPARTKDDRQVVLLSTNTYSPLTTQKQNAAWSSTRQHYQISVHCFTDRFDTNWDRARFQVLDMKLAQLHADLLELNSGVRNVIIKINNIENHAHWLITFLGEFFKRKEYPKNALITFPRLTKLSAGRSECENIIARHYAPNIVEKITREQARTEKTNERKRAEQERYYALEAAALENWKQGGPSGCFYNSTIALRYLPTTNEIETSRGARVPLPAALALYERLTTAPESIHGFPIGNFQVRDFIGANGDRVLRVGCHEIPFKEIERIREELP